MNLSNEWFLNFIFYCVTTRAHQGRVNPAYLPKVTLRKLLLDMVPSSSVDVTRAVRGRFRDLFSFRFVPLGSEGKPPTL